MSKIKVKTPDDLLVDAIYEYMKYRYKSLTDEIPRDSIWLTPHMRVEQGFSLNYDEQNENFVTLRFDIELFAMLNKIIGDKK